MEVQNPNPVTKAGKTRLLSLTIVLVATHVSNICLKFYF